MLASHNFANAKLENGFWSAKVGFASCAFFRIKFQVSLQFSTFIGYCKDVYQSSHDGENSFIESKKHLSAESGDEEHGFPQQIYLAQVINLLGE